MLVDPGREWSKKILLRRREFVYRREFVEGLERGWCKQLLMPMTGVPEHFVKARTQLGKLPWSQMLHRGIDLDVGFTVGVLHRLGAFLVVGFAVALEEVG